MEKITLQTLDRRLQKAMATNFFLRDAMPEPAPFPGRWPTHIAFRVRRSTGIRHPKLEETTYIGKPTANVLTRLAPLIAHRPGSIVNYDLFEFDRKHLVWTNTPTYLAQSHPALLYYYHGIGAMVGRNFNQLIGAEQHRFGKLSTWVTPVSEDTRERYRWKEYMRTHLNLSYKDVGMRQPKLVPPNWEYGP